MSDDTPIAATVAALAHGARAAAMWQRARDRETNAVREAVGVAVVEHLHALDPKPARAPVIAGLVFALADAIAAFAPEVLHQATDEAVDLLRESVPIIARATEA